MEKTEGGNLLGKYLRAENPVLKKLGWKRPSGKKHLGGKTRVEKTGGEKTYWGKIREERTGLENNGVEKFEVENIREKRLWRKKTGGKRPSTE